MDEVLKYGQENFNLPHDVIKLPSKGVFYKPKRESLKIGYLTAQDENLLMSQNMSGTDLIKTLLRNKIYEHGFDVEQLLPGDVQAILLFYFVEILIMVHFSNVPPIQSILALLFS
jgi:hypothetical protein